MRNQHTDTQHTRARIADAHIVTAMEDVVIHIRTRTTVTVSRLTVRLKRPNWV